MSRGNRLLQPPVGVGLAIALLLVATGLYNHYEKAYGHNCVVSQDCQNRFQDVHPSSPEDVVVYQAPPLNPHPSRQEWRSEQNLQAQRDMARWAFDALILSGIAAFATVLGLVYVKKTLDLTRKAVEDSARSADAAVQAIEQSELHAQRQLRAYISLKEAKLKDVAVGMQPKAIIKFLNCGSTPAYETKIIQNIAIYNFVNRMSPEFDGSDITPSKMTVGPGVDVHNTIKSSHILTEGDIIGLNNGQLAIYVYGIASYVDAFGENRFTNYRLICGGDSGDALPALNICEEGNEAN